MTRQQENLPPMEHRSIEANGARMHYRIGGEGAPLVLMHGWGCNASTLASIERTALLTGRKVINVDFPGFGDSPEPPGIWGVDEYANLIEKLIESEGLEGTALLGHSFGGRVGILLASRHPSTEKLILVDAAGIKPKRSFSYYRKVYTFKLLKKTLQLMLGKKRAQARIDAIRAKRGSSDYASASPLMRSILSKVVNEDLTSYLSGIKAPTLLIWGEEDTATPLADAKIMNKRIPDSGLVSFPGCGHYSFLDNPRQFSAVLESFLNS